MNARPVEIVCSACGADTLLTRSPRYEGLKRAGDILKCASCGHTYASEAEVPFKTRRAAAVFTEADRSRKADVFESDEKGRVCRCCRHYVVNPFAQRCGLSLRSVEATDTCARFARRDPAPPAGPPAPRPL